MDRLFAAFAQRGLAARAVTVPRLADLERETDALLDGGTLAPALRALYLPDGFDYAVVRRDPALRTVVIVATPSPQVGLTFHLGDRTVPARIGPGYVDRRRVLEQVKAIAGAVLGALGFRTAPVTLPKKLLAARSGLGRYGRNNLLYVPGMGSFHRLTAFATDAPAADGDVWDAPRMVDRCQTCTACQRTCPTGAIGTGRFLVHAERCVTFFNEKALPVPAWADLGGGGCLVGCMGCQLRCPENRWVRDAVEHVADFSVTETAALLDAAAPESLPDALRAKLAALALLPYLPVLPRNLRALVDGSERSGGGRQ